MYIINIKPDYTTLDYKNSKPKPPITFTLYKKCFYYIKYINLRLGKLRGTKAASVTHSSTTV